MVLVLGVVGPARDTSETPRGLSRGRGDAIDATSPRQRRAEASRPCECVCHAVEAAGAPHGLRRRLGQDAAYKPVPIIINNERVVVARLLHLALLDERVERMLDQ